MNWCDLCSYYFNPTGKFFDNNNRSRSRHSCRKTYWVMYPICLQTIHSVYSETEITPSNKTQVDTICSCHRLIGPVSQTIYSMFLSLFTYITFLHSLNPLLPSTTHSLILYPALVVLVTFLKLSVTAKVFFDFEFQQK